MPAERLIVPIPSLRRRSLLVLAGAALAGGWALRGAGAWDESQLHSQMAARYGEPGLRRLQAWLEMLRTQSGLSVAQQLQAVNAFWNQQLLATEDLVLWKEADYWATPLESLGKGAGDCEDYVIGKFFSLARLGVSPQQMRLIYVRARVGGIGSTQSIAHMVLGFYDTPQADPLVLDNLVGSIQPATQRADLTPVFSFNAQGIYVGGQRSAPSDRINRWQDLQQRMRKEGFDAL
ncbi:transglutaminase-like cysteine peptidase [Comamonas aquatica]|jgi:predicted transglutaminase-like cysteine proteinase|uniref:Transglutaminase-like cysteine peptidase n=1 Tax=Comamonas aquatica TaxID=225991 RepID=A0AA42W6I6_9BURK|nr:transglutaminase-like cysteine peptidase [Comamonas aquatica]MDH0371072.1 transglutaminase-like cysteine peptidase [Comamonas aquatica]MDH1427217.1 transglutaminase-like cysteine peptidase [Comamonas aquatica]MDH1605157.1 transglutaminase-like cysteine peptidase [Comamonas aquatica]MDH1619389.1 transglutaminase-like cysteine peptidase [Comamonas aquatica]MDH2007368.1 transglutaminase-like cysteine peptidase [Comamonas aquatica]